MTRKLIGTVVDHEGTLSLKIENAAAWFPLGGNSGTAVDFVEAFGPAQRGDIGKRVFRVDGVMQMENDEQRDARLAGEPK
jgi:hypothetical protein